MRQIVLVTLTVLLAACAPERPQSTTTPGLETGITSNNGGGTATLNNNPSVGVTTRVR